MSVAALSSRAIVGAFYQRLASPTVTWPTTIGMTFNSDQDSETYKWLGMVPQMREWVGGRQAKGFRDNGITVENKHFEATIEIPVSHMRRDKTGQAMVRIRELANRANAHWASLLTTLIADGESAVCYDGQYFFDTDHAEGSSGSQSNDITVDVSALPATVHGSTTAPSVEEMSGAIIRGVEQIYSLKDDQGEPMNEDARRFLVQCPTGLWSVAKQAVAQPLVASGQSNLVRVLDDLEVTVSPNPRLAWTDRFAIYRIDGEVRPFILQQEKPIELKVKGEGSEFEFDHDAHQYGVDTWRNVAYGFWQSACLVTLV